MSTVIRFRNRYINIAATVRQTAKILGYDEVNAQDIAHELACQGLSISDGKIGRGASKQEISMGQIKGALSNNFYYCGKGHYAVSVESATKVWRERYHFDEEKPNDA